MTTNAASPTPYAFEKVLQDSRGTEIARLEAQNRLYERQGPLDLLPAVPDAGWILDVGSGTGYWSVRLAGLVPRGRVVCLDRSPELLEQARQRFGQVGLEAEFLHQDLRELHLPEGRFDLVFTCMTLVHVVELEETLLHLRAALKPGGWIACYEPLQEGAGLFDAYPACPALAFLVREMLEEARERGSDLAAGIRIAHLLDRLGMTETRMRYFGDAPHGEDLREWVQEIFLPIARTFLSSRFQPDFLETRMAAALQEALRPGTWINLKRTVTLGRKPLA
jgi:SAM-dependent methyltransferase